MLISDTQIETILKHLSKNALNVLMVAEKSDFDVEILIQEANNRGIRIAGGIFPMILHDEKCLETGVIMKKLNSNSDTHICHVTEDEYDVNELPDLSDEINSCILFVDGFMPSIPRFLESLYEKYWNSVDFFGAGCGSINFESSPCIFSNEGLFQDAALLISVSTNMNFGVKHGWEKVEGPVIANKTDKNKILELNWRPAFEVYKEIVENNSAHSFDNEDFYSIAKGYPFGIYKQEEEEIVRDILAVGENNEIICVTDINENVSLNILHGNKENLISCAGDASKCAFDGVEAEDFLIVDCISRVLFLGDDFSKELKSVKESVRTSNSELEGVVSLGEISSVEGGILELYNKTIVVATFYT